MSLILAIQCIIRDPATPAQSSEQWGQLCALLQEGDDVYAQLFHSGLSPECAELLDVYVKESRTLGMMANRRLGCAYPIPAPRTEAQRQAKRRQSLKDAGLERREYHATPAEHERLAARLKDMRK